jgi:HEAT repeat protein
VYALGEIAREVPGVIPTLVEALDDSEVRWAACDALERIGPKAKDAVPGLTRVVREEKHDATLRSAIRALGHIGPDAASAVPALTALLQRPDQTLRADAARALGAIGPGAKQAVPSLLAVYERDESPGYDREAVVSALHRIDTEAAKRHGIP